MDDRRSVFEWAQEVHGLCLRLQDYRLPECDGGEAKLLRELAANDSTIDRIARDFCESGDLCWLLPWQGYFLHQRAFAASEMLVLLLVPGVSGNYMCDLARNRAQVWHWLLVDLWKARLKQEWIDSARQTIAAGLPGFAP